MSAPRRNAARQEVAPPPGSEALSATRRLYYALRQIAHGVEIDSRRLEKAYGITGQQWACLDTIAELGPTPAISVGRRIHLSSSTLVGLVDRLEAKGLVERHPDRQDRRKLRLVATPAGKMLVAEARHPLLSALRGFLDGRTKADQLAAVKIVEALAGAIDHADNQAQA